MTDRDLEGPHEGSPPQEEPAPKPSLITRQIAQLLLDRGLKANRLVAWVADTIEVARRTARRKLDGEAGFTEDELTVLLGELGYEYRGLDGIQKKGVSDDDEMISAHSESHTGPYECEANIEGRLRPCKVWVRKEQTPMPGAKGGKVLVPQDDGSYKLSDLKEVKDPATALLVESIAFEHPWEYEGTGDYLLIMDEQESAGEMMASALRNAGFRTKSVSSLDELAACLQTESPAAFLISWASCSNWSPRQVAELIRQKTRAPITFSAGFEESEHADLLNAVDLYDADILPQPAKSAVLIRHLLSRIRRGEVATPGAAT